MPNCKTWEKAAWIIVCSVLSALALRQIAALIAAYVLQPTSTMVTNEQGPRSFPTILLCPQPPIDPTEVRPRQQADAALFLQALAVPAKQSADALSQVGTWDDERLNSAQDRIGQGAQALHPYLALGYQCAQLVTSCSYGPKAKSLDCCANGTTVPTIYGQCVLVEWESGTMAQGAGHRHGLTLRLKGMPDSPESTATLFLLANWTYLPATGVMFHPRRGRHTMFSIQKTVYKKVKDHRKIWNTSQSHKEQKKAKETAEIAEMENNNYSNETTTTARPVMKKEPEQSGKMSSDYPAYQEQVTCCFTRCLMETSQSLCQCTPMYTEALLNLTLDPFYPFPVCNLSQVQSCLQPLAEMTEEQLGYGVRMGNMSGRQEQAFDQFNTCYTGCSAHSGAYKEQYTITAHAMLFSTESNAQQAVMVTIYYGDAYTTIYEEFYSMPLVQMLQEIALAIITFAFIGAVIYGAYKCIKCKICPGQSQCAPAPAKPAAISPAPVVSAQRRDLNQGQAQLTSPPDGRAAPAGDAPQRHQMELYPPVLPALPQQSNGHA